MTAMLKMIPLWLWAALGALIAIGYLSWRLDDVKADRDAQVVQVGQLTAAAESRKKTQKLLLDLDTQHTQEQAKADAQTKPMLTAVATGTQRVYVKASCPSVRATTTPASQPDADGRAELDPATAERILHTGVDGDNAIRQLTLLQKYVKTVCLGQAE